MRCCSNYVLTLTVSYLINYSLALKCGTVPKDNRIVGGRATTVPSWYAALIDPGTQTRNLDVYCGSTLITSRHLLTAAHCYYWLNGTRAPCSRYDAVFQLQNRCRGDYAKVVKVRSCVTHPGFSYDTLRDDIAVLTLATRVDFMPACLPRKSSTTSSNNYFFNRRGIIYGYGVLETDGYEPCVIQRGDVEIFSRVECLNTTVGLITDFINMVCAGTRDFTVDACQGDSGGPLVNVNQEMSYVVGITSFGIGCAQKNSPGVYTFVPAYIGWIRSKIKNRVQYSSVFRPINIG